MTTGSITRIFCKRQLMRFFFKLITCFHSQRFFKLFNSSTTESEKKVGKKSLELIYTRFISGNFQYLNSAQTFSKVTVSIPNQELNSYWKQQTFYIVNNTMQIVIVLRVWVLSCFISYLKIQLQFSHWRHSFTSYCV